MYKIQWKKKYTKTTVTGISSYPTIQKAQAQVTLWGYLFDDNVYEIISA